jgi:hypothetical protein
MVTTQIPGAKVWLVERTRFGGVGGRLGNAATRDQVVLIARELEARGWEITGGGGGPEEFIPRFPGTTRGGAYPDITAVKNGRTLRINTYSSDGITATTDEAARAANLRSLLKPGQHLLMVPKKQ